MPGIPRIVPYSLPAEGDLPTGGAPWKVDGRRAALLIHDMQNYFVNAFEGQDPITQVIANIATLRRHCDQTNVPVIYTAQVGSQDPRDRGLQRHIWGAGMSAGSGQPDIVEVIRPEKHHFVLTKWRYSGFQRSTLEHLLRARGLDQLIICGVFAHVGCLLTAADAFMRDIEPFIVADGVADFSREKHDMAMAYAAECFARPITTDRLLKEI